MGIERIIVTLILLIKVGMTIAISKRTLIHSKQGEVTETCWMYSYILINVVPTIILIICLEQEVLEHITIIFLMYLIIMILESILVFKGLSHYLDKVQENSLQQAVIEQQNRYINHYGQMGELDEQQKEFIHNTVHYLKMIGKLAYLKECDEIIKLIHELNVEITESAMMKYSDDHLLNVILSEKKDEAERRNIVIDVYVEPGVNLKRVASVDLVTMLGNLLANALRAADETKTERWVKVRIFMQDVAGFCVIKITNGFSTVKIKENRLISTKEESGVHGLGLKSVDNTAEKYGGYLNYTMKDQLFEVILLLSVDEE